MQLPLGKDRNCQEICRRRRLNRIHREADPLSVCLDDERIHLGSPCHHRQSRLVITETREDAGAQLPDKGSVAGGPPADMHRLLAGVAGPT